MEFNMADTTKRSNIKPVFGFIAGVVVLFCLFTTSTFESISSWQSAPDDGIFYSRFGFFFFGMPLCILPVSLALTCLALLRLPVSFPAFFTRYRSGISQGNPAIGRSAFYSLPIFSPVKIVANLTIRSKAIIHTPILIKLGKWLNFFASAALFRYLRFPFIRNTTPIACFTDIAFAFLAGFNYNGFRHDQFPKNWLCYKPPQGRPLCGFLYYRGKYGSCQGKTEENR